MLDNDEAKTLWFSKKKIVFELGLLLRIFGKNA
jgi:hypothetical protein